MAKIEANDLFLEPIVNLEAMQRYTDIFMFYTHFTLISCKIPIGPIRYTRIKILLRVSSYPSNSGFSQKRFNQHDACFQNGSHIHNMDGPIFHREAFKFCCADLAISRNEPLKNRRI